MWLEFLEIFEINEISLISRWLNFFKRKVYTSSFYDKTVKNFMKTIEICVKFKFSKVHHDEKCQVVLSKQFSPFSCYLCRCHASQVCALLSTAWHVVGSGKFTQPQLAESAKFFINTQKVSNKFFMSAIRVCRLEASSFIRCHHPSFIYRGNKNESFLNN